MVVNKVSLNLHSLCRVRYRSFRRILALMFLKFGFRKYPSPLSLSIPRNWLVEELEHGTNNEKAVPQVYTNMTKTKITDTYIFLKKVTFCLENKHILIKKQKVQLRWITFEKYITFSLLVIFWVVKNALGVNLVFVSSFTVGTFLLKKTNTFSWSQWKRAGR